MTLTYGVHPTPGGWSADCACRSARDDAARDHLAILTAETMPQEFRGFVPAQGQTAAPPPTCPRLLVDNGGDARPDLKS